MKWKIVSPAEFQRHIGMLESLNTQGAGTPLLNPDFLGPLLREFGTGREVLALCKDANEPLALALVTPIGNGIWQTFQPAQAPIGAWIQRSDVPVELLLESLLKALPGFAFAVGITQQDPDLRSRPADEGRTTTVDYIRTARITVKGSFEDYWQARGKNLKQNLRKQRNRLEKDGISPTLEIVRDPHDIAQAIADYGTLESAGWKASGGTAVHPDNAQGRFYRAMLENFCEQGQGCVYRYRFNDQIVAVDLCIEADSTLIILKTTHDESIKGYSPAFLMREESFQKLFEERQIKRIEFYGKLMDWHTKWSNENRLMYHVNYHRWLILPKIRHFVTEIRQWRNT